MTNTKFENDAETVKSCRLCVVWLPFREAVKPPLFVPVLRDRLSGELFDGQPLGFDPGGAGIRSVKNPRFLFANGYGVFFRASIGAIPPAKTCFYATSGIY